MTFLKYLTYPSLFLVTYNEFPLEWWWICRCS